MSARVSFKVEADEISRDVADEVEEIIRLVDSVYALRSEMVIREILWSFGGLAPAILALSGTFMGWKRKFR